jgi:PKD repeat protein
MRTTRLAKPAATHEVAQPAARRARLALLAMLIAVTACGGDDDPVAPPPPPPANQDPVAAFTAGANPAAGQPVVLDASASSDPDGQALSFSWDLGDGVRAGGARLAHTFANGGDYTVVLTVDDGNGGRTQLSRVLTVTPGANAAAVVQTLAIVRALDGTPLAGVTVMATVPTPGVPGTPSATTDAQGRAVLDTGTDVPVTLKFSRSGYADQFRNASLPADADSGYLEVTMQPRAPALTLASGAAGGTLVGRDGATVVFPPGALVDATGNAVGGPVQVTMTPVDVGRDTAAFPGRFEGTRPAGERGLIVSYGTVEYALSVGGAPVQLAPGRRATIEIPIYTSLNLDGSEVRVGDNSPLWSLNERTGGWTEEGSGVVVASTASPSGLALRAEVSHFSWWNHDAWTGPSARPRPRCKVDTNADGVLEDLTDTGHCWHLGLNNPQIDSVARSGTVAGVSGKDAPLGVSAVDLGSGRKRVLNSTLADPPPTRRLPAFAAYDSTPAGGGKVLEIPADVDVIFRSYANNGTLFGMKVVNLGARVEQDIDILLSPVQDNPGTLAATLPYDESFLLRQVGETDAFTFTANGADEYEVKVEAAPGSLIRGSAQVLDASLQPVDGGTFATSTGGYIGLVPASVSGTVTVRVSAASSVPGAYRISLRRVTSSVGGCLTNEALTLEAASLPLRVLRANSLHCWSLTLGAAEWVEIRNQQVFSGATGTISLRAPDGRILASDPYGAAAGPAAAGMLLRLGLVEAGTYRVEVTNTVANQATFQGLQARRLTGVQVLGPTGSLTLDDVNGPASVKRMVGLQPAAAGQPFALLTQGPARYTAYPSQQFTSAGNEVEILALSPPPAGMWPLVEFERAVTGAATPVVVSQAPVAPLALDTDVIGTGPAAGSAAALVFEGTAGAEVSWNFAKGSGSSAQLRLVAPSGRGIGGEVQRNELVTLPETGRYTLGVYTPSGSSPAGYTARINTVAAPQPLARTTGPAPIVLEGSLALGQVRRWTLPVQAGDAFAQLRVQSLASPFGALVQLRRGAVFIDRHRSGDQTVGPLWVTAAATWTVLVSALNNPDGTLATLAGPYRVTLGQVAPQPLAVDQAFSRALDTDGAVLLAIEPGATTPVRWCLRTVPTGAALAVFNRGWISEPVQVNAGDDTSLRHGPGTLAANGNRLLLRAGAASTASLRITPNPTPETLTLGAAAVAGSSGPCRSGYHRFAGTPGAAYTARIDAAFSGTVRAYFQNAGTDWVSRGVTAVGLSRALTSDGGVTNHSFTIPSNFSAGTWVIEVEAAEGASGSYTLQLTSP